jgi:phosphatidylserine/phosphatidylglycerophosphate/cardiolipin synthase-like enzyme
MIPPPVAREIVQLARDVPPIVLSLAAREVEASAEYEWPRARTIVLQSVSQPELRQALSRLLDVWYAELGSAPRTPLAWAMLSAAYTAAAVRNEQAAELVWTGPRAGSPALRHTDQALQEIVNSATRTLLLVSFAVHVVPHIREALVAAAARGVRIQLVVETSDESEGAMTYDTVRSLHPIITANATVYVWPLDQRPRSEGGRPGLLHAKCAVADGVHLFVSSANLTGQALTNNMELGLLLRGGHLPADVHTHFQRLIERGILVPVPPT